MFKNQLAHLKFSIKALTPYLEKGSISEKECRKLSVLLDVFLNLMPHPTYPFIPNQLVRATKNISIPEVGNNRITQIRHLKYPPKESVVRHNRCNIPGMSVLYGSFHLLTSAKELRPNIGDLVTHSEWQIKDSHVLNSFPIFFIAKSEDDVYNQISLEVTIMHNNFINELSNDEKEYFNSAMEFLAKVYSKEIDPDNHYDYFLSSYISNRIFENTLANYDAIIYPSVQEHLGLSNMAINPEVFDSKFDLTKVNNDILINYGGSDPKGFFFRTLGHTKLFDIENGVILWKD